MSGLEDSTIHAALTTFSKILPLPMVGAKTTNNTINRAIAMMNVMMDEVLANEYLFPGEKETFAAQWTELRNNHRELTKKLTWTDCYLSPNNYWRAVKFEKGVQELVNKTRTASDDAKMQRDKQSKPAKQSDADVADRLVSARNDPKCHAAILEAGLAVEDVKQLIAVRGDNVYYSGDNNPSPDRPAVLVQQNTYHVYVEPHRGLRRIRTSLDTPFNRAPLKRRGEKSSK
ncbi:hypothetical protein PILCRDRAFT_90377 [Piloderma croceum F 1598]|uniref:Uncharacterized protein n=1 Tax=Piloderma croceum (strain F 1598) TaxID=765440 RepID=A0A0C3FG63_PILCF|nr:hypothetical protein PILCRDRAFT_90377 [Piloderma croceum F 1598]